MGKCHHGRPETDLNWGLSYVYDTIANKIMSERKTDMVGVLAVNSDGKYNVAEFVTKSNTCRHKKYSNLCYRKLSEHRSAEGYSNVFIKHTS